MASNDEETCEEILPETNTVCSLCVKAESKYTCPRCNVRYCSVECYRGEKHLSCSEQFYRNCVLDEMKDIKASPEERQQILEMLARTENDYGDSDDDADDEEDLESRIAGLNLDEDTDELWQRLSDKEKREFHTMVRDGRVANLVEVWTPWWFKQKMVCGMEEEKDTQMTNTTSETPVILKTIEDINSLLKNKKASSDVRYNVVNALFAYAFVARLHNGGHLEMPVDSAQMMLSVSDVLNSSKSCSTTGEAIHMSLSNIHKLEKVKERERFHHFTISVIEDIKIITGPSDVKSCEFPLAALSDLYTVFKRAKHSVNKELKKEDDREKVSDGKKLKTQLFLAEKKVAFLLSWCHRYGMALQPLCLQLDLEFCSLSSELATVTSTKMKFEESWGGHNVPIKPRKLIQEIPT